MTATTKTTSRVATRDKAFDAIARASLISMGSVSALVGLWATACLVGAVMTSGIGQVAAGFFSALAG